MFTFATNDFGQLGIGTYVYVGTPTLVPRSNFGGESIVKMSAGTWHSAVLSASGKFYTFGKNWEGQLGTGDNLNRNIPTLIPSIKFDNQTITQFACGGSHTIVLTSKFIVF